jgi:DNA-binding NtrC family response regulator
MAMPHPTLLLIAPDPQARHDMGAAATAAGFAVQAATSGSDALAHVRQRPPDVVLAYVDVPDMDGLSLVRRFRDEAPDAALVLVADRASLDSAVEAIRLGVRHYLRPPVDASHMRTLLGDLHDASLRRRVHLFPAERSSGVAFHGMVGRSQAMQRLFRLLRQVAPHVRTALITGETGTGKELVARALHRLGPRADRRFVVINCSAVVETLFESELFGHVRGAFTGASESKAGLFELADGGTLFLDEVGELPPAVQAKLLRAIEYGEVLRVGSLEPRRVDVQILAATNRDLDEQCAAGRFRRDLFYRLNVVEVHVPSLRERRDDIVYLASHFMREMATRFAKPLTGLTAAGERLLTDAEWTGNVRELRNVMERACLLADGALVGEAEVRASLPHQRRAAPPAAPPAGAVQMLDVEPSDTQPLSDVEREAIVRALQRAGGNKKAAASMLGVSRRALYRRLERLDLGRTITRRGEGAA